MKKLFVVLALGLMVGLSFAKAEEPKEEIKPLKPLTALQRRAVIKELRQKGKLKQFEVRQKGDKTPSTSGKEALEIPLVSAAPVMVAPKLILPETVNVKAQIVDISADELPKLVHEVIKNPGGVVVMLQILHEIDPVKADLVSATVNTLSETEIKQSLVGITGKQIELMLSRIETLSPSSQGLVIKALNLAPVEAIAPALLTLNHEAVSLVLQGIDTPRVVSVAGLMFGSLAKTYVVEGDWAKLEDLLRKGGVNETLIQAFLLRLKK